MSGTGTPVAGVGRAKHGSDDSTVVVALSTLDDGSYVVDWHVVSADSHPVSGAFTFSVGKATSDEAAIVAALDRPGHRDRDPLS